MTNSSTDDRQAGARLPQPSIAGIGLAFHQRETGTLKARTRHLAAPANGGEDRGPLPLSSPASQAIGKQARESTGRSERGASAGRDQWPPFPAPSPWRTSMHPAAHLRSPDHRPWAPEAMWGSVGSEVCFLSPYSGNPEHRRLVYIMGGIAFLLLLSIIFFYRQQNRSNMQSQPPSLHQPSHVTPNQGQAQTPTTSGLSLHIAGNHLINARGEPIRLFGINRIAGIPCTSAHPRIFDGHYDRASVMELTKWHINTVRITMNEDCWLGINHAPAQTSGRKYREAIISYVHLLNAYGMYAIIDLHINAPGAYISADQQVMADKDHAIAYWTSVADTFKNDPAVIFEPYNEPHITRQNSLSANPWDCWLKGCTITQIYLKQHQPPIAGRWQAVGMQSMVNAIRNTGATNVITLGGLSFSNDLTKFLEYLPSDPMHQLAASFHNYQPSAMSKSGCGPTCWDAVILPISKKMPVITDEFGGVDCQSSFVTEYMNWADRHGISYLPWGWDPWGCTTKGSPTGHAYGMLSNWNGRPNSYGLIFYRHFAEINP